jgi:hypothetical protein
LSDSPKQVIGFNRNAWSDSAETGDRIQPKRVIAFTRNPHPEVDDQERAAMRELGEGNDKLRPVSIARAPRPATSIRKR